MDYVTRQFIDLTKQFRKELRKYQESLHHDLVQLSDRFKNSVDATKAQGKAHDKSSDTPPITIAELRTQEPIRVQTKTKKTKPEWAWALIKGTLEIGVAIAVMEYTFVTRDILNQQTDATNFAGRQTELSRKALNETRKDFILDESASISPHFPSPMSIEESKDDPPKRLHVDAIIENIGKTNATGVHGLVMATVVNRNKKITFDYIDATPVELNFFAPGFPRRYPIAITGLRPDHSTRGGTNWLGIGDLVARGDVFIVGYGTLKYRDVFTQKEHILNLFCHDAVS
jgi:hypothetical protein